MSDRAPRKPGQPTLRSAAQSVVERLQRAGHLALFAGGCVRDMLMGKRPSDYDVATSAEPRQVIGLFKRTQQVGAKFGVVLARVGPYSIEVATFRRDMDYSDGRRPSAVEFTDAREDALRRDFTINGMFYDPLKREVIDYVQGQKDLARRVVRAIGQPQRRFAEDHLRLLRAVRFSARLDFRIDPATWGAMRAHAAEIATISPERIREELEAILSHRRRAPGFRVLCKSGLLPHLWPTAAKVLPHRNGVEKHLAALPVNADFELAFAAILAALPRDAVSDACDAVRCSNQVKKAVCWLHANQETLADPSRLTLADLKHLMAHPAFDRLLKLFAAALKSKHDATTAYREITARVRRIAPDAVAPPPLLTGHDLENMGLAKGPAYKRILERVYYMQLDERLESATDALAVARRLIAEESK